MRCEDPARLASPCTPPSHRLALLTPTSPATGSGVRTLCSNVVCPLTRRCSSPFHNPTPPHACTLDAGQTVFSATVLLLLRICISVVPLGSALQQLPWALQQILLWPVLPCPCASIRYDFPNPHQCTWNSQAARRRTPLRSLRSSSLGSNEFCVDSCTCYNPTSG